MGLCERRLRVCDDQQRVGQEALNLARRPKICLATLQAISARAFLLPLVQALVQRGYEVHVVTSPDGNDGLPDLDTIDGAVLHRIAMPCGIAPVADLGAIIRLRRFLLHERFDLVHAHMSKCASLVLPAAWLTHVPVRLYTNHGMAFLSARGGRRWLLRAIETISCRLAQRVYFVSFSNRVAAISSRIVTSDKSAVLAKGSICGIDADRFAPNAGSPAARRALREQLGIDLDSFVVGHVGRAVTHKGYNTTVRMWWTHFADEPRCHLLLVGSTQRDLERVLGGRPPRNVSVIEWSDRMPDCYAAMDVVVMPSQHEGLGYTLLEAGAAERPVVGSCIPGVLDAIDEEVTGLLVPPGDDAALAGAIRRLMSDRDLCRQLGSAGAARVRARYAQAEACEAFAREYDRILGLGRTRGS